MLNQIVLVGRIESLNTVEKGEDNTNILECIIAIPRPFKNGSGVYESDHVKTIVKENIKNNILEYCRVGDLIGIKGRVEGIINNIGEVEQSIIAEKVTFLSSRKKDESEEG